MSESPSSATDKSVSRLIKGPQEFYGGLALVAIALFALWASSDLQSMQGYSFGSGTAPRIFGVLLAVLGVGVAIMGLISEGSALQRYGVRGPLFVIGAILFFALMIRPLGLIVTGFLVFVIAALGSNETRWGETIIVGALMTAGCALLFPYALGLPLDMLPFFLR